MDSFEKFIVENGNADTVRLVMACKEWPVPEDAELAELDAKSLAVNTIEGRRRLRKKLPEWVACTGLVYPSSLCAEQCSSSDTARYKASIVQRIFNEYVGTVASMVGDPCRTTGSATENKMVTEPAEVTIGTRKTGRIFSTSGEQSSNRNTFFPAESLLAGSRNMTSGLKSPKMSLSESDVASEFFMNIFVTPSALKLCLAAAASAGFISL